MEASNIVAGSNVFLCRTEYPYHDPEFVKQIQDYKLIKYISSRKLVDPQVQGLFGNQDLILKTEMRCVYAKNDPCWGYKKSKNKVASACINSECPKLYECNPDYTEGEAMYWVTTEEERNLYGKPEQLLRYYIVDMISDEEMNRYVVSPGNDGIDHSTPPTPTYKPPEPEIKSTAYKIDPITGRKMVVIGYKKLKYPDEDGLGDPIWGFVDEMEAEIPIGIIRRAKKLEKKKDVQNIKKLVVAKSVITKKNVDQDYAHKAEYEKKVTEHVRGEIRLTNLNENYISPNDTVILFDNCAEMAFVSGTLLIDEIDHGYSDKDNVTLALIDDYDKYTSKNNVFISSTTLKKGCNDNNIKAWKTLAEKNNIQQLTISNRDFYEFSYESGKRWTCRNMYGVTHVCVTKDDIVEIESLNDGIYPVSLVDDVVYQNNGTPLGHISMSFVKLIKELKEKNEITAMPEVIKGISLKVCDGNIEILGMGHLKFVEY